MCLNHGCRLPAVLAYANILCQRDRVSHYVIPIISISCSNVDFVSCIYSQITDAHSRCCMFYFFIERPFRFFNSSELPSFPFFSVSHLACRSDMIMEMGMPCDKSIYATVRAKNKPNKRLTDRSALIAKLN